MKKILKYIENNIVVALVVTIILMMSFYNAFITPNSRLVNENLSVESNELYERFIKENPEKIVLKSEYSDVSDDGKKDLIVIYKTNEIVRMSGYISVDDKYIMVEEVPAPVENQTIKLKDIDDKGVVEFIVSGSKNGVVGYSIFRFEGNQFINLFAQDMDDCCN